MEGLFNYALDVCRRLEIDAGVDRIERILRRLRTPVTLSEMHAEMRVLGETIEDGLRYIGFYHYPNQKRQLLQRVEAREITSLTIALPMMSRHRETFWSTSELL